MRILMSHRARQLSSGLAGDPAPTEKSLPLSIITGHRATKPATLLETTKVERLRRLAPIKRVATMGSRAPPPVTRVIRATSHTTRETARRGKMCGTLHKRTFTDRGYSAWPPLPSFIHVLVCNWLTDFPVPLLLSDSSLRRLMEVLKHLLCLSICFLGWQAKKWAEKRAKNIIGNGFNFLDLNWNCKG